MMRSTSSRIRCIAVVAVVALLGMSGMARGADPGAPPGAPTTWLPKQDWVLDHWLPYDETRLDTILGMSHGQIVEWLRNHDDHAALSELATERGVPTRGLAARLVGPRPRSMSPQLYALLVQRAALTLTQPHLMHHMLGHKMHVGVLLKAFPSILGVSRQDLHAAHRDQGLSYAQIGAAHGVSEPVLYARIMSVLRATELRAVRLQQTPAAQARRWLSLQQSGLTRWLEYVPRSGSAQSADASLTGTSSTPAAQPAAARVRRSGCACCCCCCCGGC